MHRLQSALPCSCRDIMSLDSPMYVNHLGKIVWGNADLCRRVQELSGPTKAATKRMFFKLEVISVQKKLSETSGRMYQVMLYCCLAQQSQSWTRCSVTKWLAQFAEICSHTVFEIMIYVDEKSLLLMYKTRIANINVNQKARCLYIQQRLSSLQFTLGASLHLSASPTMSEFIISLARVMIRGSG